MKAIVLVLALAAGIGSACSQGQVNFANTPTTFNDGIDRRVYTACGPLVGSNFAAALYFGYRPDVVDTLAVRSVADQSLLSAVGPFREISTTNSLAGTWVGGSRYLLGTTVGQIVSLQVRVWDLGRFASYELALAGGGFHGASEVFSYMVPDLSDAPGLRMTNFRAFGMLTCVPEPSTFALGCLGLGILLSRRRMGLRATR